MTCTVLSFVRSKYFCTVFSCYNLFAFVFYPFYAQIIINSDKAQDFWHTYFVISNQSFNLRSAPFLLEFIFRVVDSSQAFVYLILILFIFSINIFSFVFLYFYHKELNFFSSNAALSLFLSLWCNTLIIGRCLTQWRWTISILLLSSLILILSRPFGFSLNKFFNSIQFSLKSFSLFCAVALIFGLAISLHPFSVVLCLLCLLPLSIRLFTAPFVQKRVAFFFFIFSFVSLITFALVYINNRFIEFVFTYSPNFIEFLVVCISVLFSSFVVLFYQRLPFSLIRSPGLYLFSYMYLILALVSLISSSFLLSRLTLIFLIYIPFCFLLSLTSFVSPRTCRIS